MKKTTIAISLILISLLSSVAWAGITVRAGAALPRGDFKDYAASGVSLEVEADLHPFSAPFLSVPVVISYSGFGSEEADWSNAEKIVTQDSKITMTGGGLGLKIEPPLLPLKPFAEVLGRLASIEQDYGSGVEGEGRNIESQTKFGLQFIGGVKYPLAPSLSAQAGASYTTFFKTKMLLDNVEREFDANVLGLFVGVTFNFGW